MADQRCPTCGNEVLVGVEVSGVYDGVLYWICTSGHAWPRFTHGRLAGASADHAARETRRQREREV